MLFSICSNALDPYTEGDAAAVAERSRASREDRANTELIDIGRNNNEMGLWHSQPKAARFLLFLAVGLQPQLEKARWAGYAIGVDTT